MLLVPTSKADMTNWVEERNGIIMTSFLIHREHRAAAPLQRWCLDTWNCFLDFLEPLPTACEMNYFLRRFLWYFMFFISLVVVGCLRIWRRTDGARLMRNYCHNLWRWHAKRFLKRSWENFWCKLWANVSLEKDLRAFWIGLTWWSEQHTTNDSITYDKSDRCGHNLQLHKSLGGI